MYQVSPAKMRGRGGATVSMAQERSTALFCGDKPQQRMGVFHENRRGTMRAFFFTLFMAGLCLWMPLTASARPRLQPKSFLLRSMKLPPKGTAQYGIRCYVMQYGIRCYVIRYDPAVQITREQLAFTLEEMRMAGGFTVQEARPGQSWVTIRAGRDLIAHSIRYAAFLSRHPSTVMRPVPSLPAGSVSQ